MGRSQVKLHHRANFDISAPLKYGATLRELHSLGKFVGPKDRVAAHDFLRLRKRPVNGGVASATDNLACALQRMTSIQQMSFVGQVVEPGLPLLQDLLDFLGSRRPRAPTIQ